MATKNGTCNCGRGLATVDAVMFGRASKYCQRCVDEYDSDARAERRRLLSERQRRIDELEQERAYNGVSAATAGRWAGLMREADMIRQIAEIDRRLRA